MANLFQEAKLTSTLVLFCLICNSIITEVLSQGQGADGAPNVPDPAANPPADPPADPPANPPPNPPANPPANPQANPPAVSEPGAPADPNKKNDGCVCPTTTAAAGGGGGCCFPMVYPFFYYYAPAFYYYPYG